MALSSTRLGLLREGGLGMRKSPPATVCLLSFSHTDGKGFEVRSPKEVKQKLSGWTHLLGDNCSFVANSTNIQSVVKTVISDLEDTCLLLGTKTPGGTQMELCLVASIGVVALTCTSYQEHPHES